jgi:uncharacterized protein
MLSLVALGEAGRLVRVYEATVPSADSPAALQEAMRQVLVRATGRRDAGNDPSLAGIVADASRYVRQYRPANDATEVVFDGEALELAIVAAGRGVWERERPFTLVVLHPPLTPEASEEARNELERAASARGLPVSVVPISLVDESGAELDRTALLRSAQRFGGDAVLVGRNEGRGAQWMWTLHGPVASASWSGSIATGVHGAVDALARSEDVSFAMAEVEALIAVDGIANLVDYASVGRLLDAVPGVRNVDLEEAAGSTVTFRVLVRGGADGLDQQLAGSTQLARVGAAGGRLQYQYRR